MLPPLDATPCPTSTPSDRCVDLRSLGLRNSFDDGDTTSNIDFTTDCRPSSRVAGVKRRATATRPKRSGSSTDFAVHQDDGAYSTKHDLSNSRRHVPTADKLSILAQPAQRPRSKVTVASTTSNTVSSKPATAAAVTGNSRQIGSVINAQLGAQHMPGNTMGYTFSDNDETIKRPARRGTVYIPSEDTTMPTVWMGVFSPIKDLGVSGQNSVGDQPADLTGIAARMAEKRGPKKSSVMAVPKRAPLHHSMRPPQETTIAEDIPGQMTGKENLPPGHEITGNKKTNKKKVLGESSQQHHQPARQPAFGLIKRPRPFSCGPDNVSSKAAYSAQPAQAGGTHNFGANANGAIPKYNVKGNLPRLHSSERGNELLRSSHSDEALTRSPQLLPPGRGGKLLAKIMVPKVAAPLLGHGYPLLSEDIQTPSLYENNWLAHQEIAITQLVNNLFDASTSSSGAAGDYVTRSKLLAMYQDQSFIILQNRLQASLLFGSLTVPKEVLTKSSRLSEDLGFKQSFVNLWLDTYDLQILRSCAEVVIGRECCTSPRTSSSLQINASSTPRKTSKQSLSRFLDTFLIRNEDMNPSNGMSDSGVTGLSRTFLRSLMLIQLLDQAKISPQIAFTGCLFPSSSPYKSSAAVIEALAQMLNPAAGNILRSLKHLNYTVSHVQYPLEEYDYHITNLAIDLRDGVKLTRLVEQLLYPSSSPLLSYIPDANTTATITMPTGETLSLLQGGDQDWPLSQHLKFPCQGRATKIYNVQLALSALSGIKGVGKIAEDIKPEHIVDGFREKTVALLWGLASKWGLGSLIDWVDLTGEICRLGDTTVDERDDDDEDDFSRHKFLLKEWAAAAAECKGLTVHNLTTSFADGRVFEAIVEQYEPYLNTVSTTTSSGSGTSSKAPQHLSQRLAALGCSAQFASLFSSHAAPAPKIFDQDFTLASLSFLASRLLSASKLPRAAITIQRGWRAVLEKREERKRVMARMLAGHCMGVVERRAGLG